MTKPLWEILVPAHSHEGIEYALDHHRAWDEKVRSLTGGLTIQKTVKGQWVSPQNEVFIDRMIPVLVHCTEPQIDEIMAFTMTHYDQEAVFAYRVIEYVKVLHNK